MCSKSGESAIPGRRPSRRNAIDVEPTLKLDGRHKRGLRRRKAILRVARAMFVKQGYKKTTLEAIIAASGGSRETLYKTFGGKQGLFRAIIADVGDTLVASIMDVEISALPPEEGLTRIANNLMAIWATAEVRAMHRVVLSEGVDAPEIMDAWYRGGPAVALAAITHYLASQRQVGRLSLDDPAKVAMQFMLLLMGELAFPTMSGSIQAFDRKAAVDRTVKLLLLAHSTRRATDEAEPLRRAAAQERATGVGLDAKKLGSIKK